MDTYDELTLKELDAYTEFQYYKSEQECPYEPQSIQSL